MRLLVGGGRGACFSDPLPLAAPGPHGCGPSLLPILAVLLACPCRPPGVPAPHRRGGSLRPWGGGLWATLGRSGISGGLPAMAPLVSSDRAFSVSPLDAPVAGCFLPWAFSRLKLSAQGASCLSMLLLGAELAPENSCFPSWGGGFHRLPSRTSGGPSAVSSLQSWSGLASLVTLNPGGCVVGVEVALDWASCLPVCPPGHCDSLGSLKSWG